jgi:drug/metabolite transporter (DMT)-like permease
LSGLAAHTPPAGELPAHRFGPAAVGLSLLTALLWGGTAVGSRIALDTLPPIAVGGARFALAALFMIAWCRWERAPLTLRAGQWGPSFWSGLLLFLQIATFNWGQARSTASHSTLFINTYIFWVAAVEHYVTRTYRLNLRQILGLFVAAAGVVLLVATSAAPSTGTTSTQGRDVATLAGDLLLLLSALLLAIKVIYTKHAVRTVPPGTLTLWHDVIGVALFIGWSAAFEHADWRRVDAATVWALLFVGVVVSGFCFAAQAWLLQKHSASLVSVFSFATPVFGVLLAVLLRGDVLSPWLLTAGVSVAVGILLVTLRGPGA